jgi:hypothetical protein
MAWPFFLTKHLSFSKTIEAPLESVLMVMHDPLVYIKLEPSIIEVNPNPTNPSEFIISEALQILCCFKLKTTYKATINERDDGFIAVGIAGAGTKTTNITSAKALGDKTTEVTEHYTVKVSGATTQCNMYLVRVSFKLVASRAFSSLYPILSTMRRNNTQVF